MPKGFQSKAEERPGPESGALLDHALKQSEPIFILLYVHCLFMFSLIKKLKLKNINVMTLT